MRSLTLVMLGLAVTTAGCMLERSGTRPDRTGGSDASIPLDGASAPHDAGPIDTTDAAREDAGPAPECAPSEERTVSCGGCGTLAERCEGGAWTPDGECVEAPPCMPGATETETEDCGMCGTRARTRACGGCDGWDPWSDFGACEGEGTCTPGESRTRTTSCACGGTRELYESCAVGCGWTTTSSGACSARTCRTVLGRDVCPGEQGGVLCPGSWWRTRLCRCSASGAWVDCDNRAC